MRIGLVSVTFRPLTVEQIVETAAAARIECIEWGGDVHVPHGDLDAAKRTARITRDAGLKVSSYGSYLRLGEKQPFTPQQVIETAATLSAPLVRVWAGACGSAQATEDDWKRVVDAALETAELAAREGIGIGYEFHGGTLTDNGESARRLLDLTQHPSISSFWQPPVGASEEEAIESLHAVLPRLCNIHAFHWWPDSTNRHSLTEGASRWSRYLSLIRDNGKTHDVLLEFLPGDSIDALAEEATILRNLVDRA